MTIAGEDRPAHTDHRRWVQEDHHAIVRDHRAVASGVEEDEVAVIEEDAEADMEDIDRETHGQGRGADRRAVVPRDRHSADHPHAHRRRGGDAGGAIHLPGEVEVVGVVVAVAAAAEEVEDAARAIVRMVAEVHATGAGAGTADKKKCRTAG